MSLSIPEHIENLHRRNQYLIDVLEKHKIYPCPATRRVANECPHEPDGSHRYCRRNKGCWQEYLSTYVDDK